MYEKLKLILISMYHTWKTNDEKNAITV